MPKSKVALGLSGGVDSSLSAALLIEQGYEVTAVFLECWRAPGCRTDQDRKDALQVALQLNIPFQVLDFKDAYKQKVVDNFLAEYQAGRTPNPDVLCNKEIKFGLFYTWAMEKGFDFVATGHYAQVLAQGDPTNKSLFSSKTTPANNFSLATSADTHKDQTYFLYRLNSQQLSHILFPIGHLTKTQVRTEADKRGLSTANKKDSVGICFIGDINVHNFLQERLGENPGEVVDTHGQVIGSHLGLWFYTVGQRHGFTIFPKITVAQDDGTTLDKHNLPPFYVIRKIPAANRLVVGFGVETETKSCSITDIHWIKPLDKNIAQHDDLRVRIRHTGELIACKALVSSDQLEVVFSKPIQGVADGQSAVFYSPSAELADASKQAHPPLICLGGGIIDTQ